MYYVYIIQNLISNKYYSGSTEEENPTYRWTSGHRPRLRGGYHENSHLQASWAKYTPIHGEKAFEWYITGSYKTSGEMLIYEQYWIDWFRKLNLCYNMRDAEPGGTFTEEVRRKIKEKRALQIGHGTKYKAFNEEKTLKEWDIDHRCIINYRTLKSRIIRGWNIEEALIIPVIPKKNRRNGKLYKAFDETKTVIEWANDPRCIVSRPTLLSRIKLNWSIELAITTHKLN